MNQISEMLKIAEIHANRIDFAMSNLKPSVPFSEEFVKKISDNELLLTEMLTSRFAKLQDYLGKKIIDAFLEYNKEMIDNLTMIDKLNRLEKLGIIEHVSLWQEMRDVRNHIAHEYPDNPEITAAYLNQIYILAPKLVELLDNIKARVK